MAAASSGSVLVLTSPHDVTTDLALRILAERQVPVVRLDPGPDLLAGVALTASNRTGDQSGTLRTPSRELDLTLVRSVWMRRPSPFEGSAGLDAEERKKVRGQANQVWVREVRAHEITAAVAACPHLFQAKVEKVFDVRLTAVGDRLFAVRIDSPDLDWRRRQSLMECTPIAIPAQVARSVHAYLADFQLTFGAFDFAVTATGRWYFLECNPNGQWAWQPASITDSIAHAVADQLHRGRSKALA